jgi:hypothetical protein
MNSPLRPAIKSGADVIHVITLNPEVNRIPLASMTNSLTTMWRQQVISWTKTLTLDIERARLLNHLLELASETLPYLAKEPGLAVHGAIQHELRGRRPITIYLYRPGDDLGGPLGLLNFKADRLAQLIERGFSDAIGWIPERASYVDPAPLRSRLAHERAADATPSAARGEAAPAPIHFPASR